MSKNAKGKKSKAYLGNTRIPGIALYILSIPYRYPNNTKTKETYVMILNTKTYDFSLRQYRTEKMRNKGKCGKI